MRPVARWSSSSTTSNRIFCDWVKEFSDTADIDVKVKIATLVLSYGYGQPTRRSEISGPAGKAIETKTTQLLEASERVVQAFGEAKTSDDPAIALAEARASPTLWERPRASPRPVLSAPDSPWSPLWFRSPHRVEASASSLPR